MTRYSGAWNYAPTRVRFALPTALRSVSRMHALSMPEVPTLPANIALEFVAFAVPGFFEC